MENCLRKMNPIDNVVTVEYASMRDAEEIARLLQDWQGGELDFYIQKTLTELSGKGRYENLVVFVARLNRQVVGVSKMYYFSPSDYSESDTEFSTSFNAPEGWYLTGITVDKDFRGQGIAAKLTEARLDFLEGNNREIYYFTDSDNSTSIRHHRKFGFQFLTNEFSFPGARVRPDAPLALFKKSLEA